jgi:hypothetical protein
MSNQQINFYHSFFYGLFGANYIVKTLCRDVAQPGRALRSGRRSRAFKSRHPDHFYKINRDALCLCNFASLYFTSVP